MLRNTVSEKATRAVNIHGIANALIKPKLLIVTTVPETLASILSGQPNYLKNSYDVTLASSPLEELDKVSKAELVPVHGIPMNRGISPWADLVSIWKMYRAIVEIKPDIVHSYTPKAGLVAMVAAFLARVPNRIHTFTGLIFTTQAGLRHHILKSADRLICAFATHVVPEGAGVMRDLTQFAVSRKPLRVIANGNISGLDTAHFDPQVPSTVMAAAALREELGLRATDFVFGFYGRFNRDKGLRELVHAFVNLPGRNAKLVLFGRYDATAPPDPDTWQAIDDHPRIQFAGFHADLRPGLLMADAIVLPSYREGFPNVLLQGSAMCRPLIATSVNGSNEIIVAGETGWLVPPKDADALGRAMGALMAMPAAEREAIGRAGRTRVKALWEQTHYREALVAFYRDILDGTAPP